MRVNLLIDPIAFRESFLAEAPSTKFDNEYSAVVNVILYYLWRGCKVSREALLTGGADPKAALIAQSGYEAILGIIQLLRVGYQADAATLLRALMERIAIIGYLGENKHLIPRYFDGDLSPYKEALAWAKKNTLQNWMILYSTLSSFVHSKAVGSAGHINNRTEIGNAFRLATKKYPTGASSLIEELLGLVIYSLLALDSLALKLIQAKSVRPFSDAPGMAEDVGINDAKEYQQFLQKLVARYGKFSKP
jgi:hypothetical protein